MFYYNQTNRIVRKCKLERNPNLAKQARVPRGNRTGSFGIHWLRWLKAQDFTIHRRIRRGSRFHRSPYVLFWGKLPPPRFVKEVTVLCLLRNSGMGYRSAPKRLLSDGMRSHSELWRRQRSEPHRRSARAKCLDAIKVSFPGFRRYHTWSCHPNNQK